MGQPGFTTTVVHASHVLQRLKPTNYSRSVLLLLCLTIDDGFGVLFWNPLADGYEQGLVLVLLVTRGSR